MIKTQQSLCNLFGIARSTLHSRMQKRGLTSRFKAYNYHFLMGWIEQELHQCPIKHKHTRRK